MAREIPSSAVLVQEGLYLYSYSKTIGGREYTFHELYSAEGYCFYETALPEEERIYMQWGTIITAAEANNYTSVPVEDWMEIANIGSNPEVM